MDLAETRKWLEVELGGKLPDFVWNRLVDRRYALADLDGTDLEMLLERAQDLCDAYRAGSGQPPRGGEEKNSGDEHAVGEEVRESGLYLDVDLGEHERNRSRAAAKVAARRLGEKREVADFRRVFLSNGLLDPEQARTFLSGPSAGVDALAFITPWWSRSYGWDHQQVAWTILTGEPPEISPLQVRAAYGPGPTTITITAEHWLSAATIKDNYAKARQDLAGDVRRPKNRSLKVVEFVEDETRLEGKRPPWPTLLERWNRSHPRSRFGTNPGDLGKAYRTAVKTICDPPVRVLWPKPTATSERKRRHLERKGDEAIANVIEMLRRSTGRRQ